MCCSPALIGSLKAYNVLSGESGDDLLMGGGDGADLIQGGDGNDFIYGCTDSATDNFIDSTYGGAGDDTYIYDNGDIFVEYASQGLDTVRSTYSYTLPNNIENL